MPKNELGAVLLTWVAVNNDPYERDRNTGDFRCVDGRRFSGPTLTLLFDPASTYGNSIDEVVFFHREAIDDMKEERALRETLETIRERAPKIKLHDRAWKGKNPTDHQEIFRFLRKELPLLRRQFEGRRLIIHLSPGTPAMQTIWALMVETGMIEPPVEMVKSSRPDERGGQPAVVPVKLGLDTFFKVYQRQHTLKSRFEEEDQVFWDPRKFKSLKLKQVFLEARRFARLNVPLLILGERGTGKTTLASWIRANSAFRKAQNDRNWPSVPCGQYNTETMRSELFGYTKGAFTGATDDKEGLLARADGDTLFLDEIGDIAKPLQRLLIRAVEEHVYSPLGSVESRTSRFRLITATNRDMSALQEKLDPDFLDRISILKIVMPPLREIREDIPWLWEQVVAEAVKRADCATQREQITAATHQILPKLQSQPLPGNIRGLFVVAYRMIAILGDDYEPVKTADVVEYALNGLQTSTLAEQSLSRELMRCFVKGLPIDSRIESLGKIETKLLFDDVRKYLADEIRRYAGAHKLRSDQICDIAERTLRQWAD